VPLISPDMSNRSARSLPLRRPSSAVDKGLSGWTIDGIWMGRAAAGTTGRRAEYAGEERSMRCLKIRRPPIFRKALALSLDKSRA